MIKTPDIKLTGLVLAALIFTAAGCSVRQAGVRYGVVPVFEDGMKVFMAEDDLELADPSIAATVKLVELLLTQDPENPELLTYASMAFASYSMAFVEDKAYDYRFSYKGQQNYNEALARAKKLYLRGRDYGLAAIRYEKGEDPFRFGVVEFEQYLKNNTDKDDVAMMMWTSINWMLAINCDAQDMTIQTQRSHVEAMLKRSFELDEHYFHGLPRVFLAGYLSSMPAIMGNFKEEALGHFNRVQKMTGNRHLLAKVFQAELLAVQYQDEQMYDRLVAEIADAPDDLWPEMGLMNALAKKKARRLKKWRDEFF